MTAFPFLLIYVAVKIYTRIPGAAYPRFELKFLRSTRIAFFLRGLDLKEAKRTKGNGRRRLAAQWCVNTKD